MYIICTTCDIKIYTSDIVIMLIIKISCHRSQENWAYIATQNTPIHITVHNYIPLMFKVLEICKHHEIPYEEPLHKRGTQALFSHARLHYRE